MVLPIESSLRAAFLCLPSSAVNPISPAIVSQAAVRPLPRAALWLVLLAYVLLGFVGRDPWRPEELPTLAVMLDMAWFGGPWLTPQVLGDAVPHSGWLAYWLGAISIGALPFLPAWLAAQLPFMALLALTLWSTWHATFVLARHSGAQPVVFAFGGDANPRDYARTLADGALLALMGSLGLALLAHEAAIDTSRLAFVALWLYVLARLCTTALHATASIIKTAGLWGLASIGLSLSGMPWLALTFALLGTLFWLRLGPGSLPQRAQGALLWLIPSAAIALLMVSMGMPWPTWQVSHWAYFAEWQSLGRTLAWFTWPSGALALWACWRWRHHWRQVYLAVPMVSGITLLCVAMLWNPSDRTLLLLLPSLSVLAALALPTLRRVVTAFIDWFAVLFFTGGAIVIWVMWFALMTGVPAKPAANIARVVPSFEAFFSWWQFIPALALTVAWGGLVAWRLGQHRAALWKPLVLSASGVVLCWGLLMSLWLPMLNHGMGLAPIAQRIAALSPPSGCVLVHQLQTAYIVAIQYHGNRPVKRPHQADAHTCTTMVVWPSSYKMPAPGIDWVEWSAPITLPRLRDNRESVLLLQRLVIQDSAGGQHNGEGRTHP